jgi:AcrR family transcriptional regulator
MGRKAGVAAEETKACLLSAAAKVFARRGYDGASISEITSEAGLTSGAIYAHYGSKAELFNATLEAYAEKDLDLFLSAGSERVADAITAIGATFDHREETESSLLISAVVAARNDPEVSRLLHDGVTAREQMFETLIASAQDSGALGRDVSAAAISRFCLMVGMGSLIVEALGMDAPDHAEWAALITRLVDSVRP